VEPDGEGEGVDQAAARALEGREGVHRQAAVLVAGAVEGLQRLDRETDEHAGEHRRPRVRDLVADPREDRVRLRTVPAEHEVEGDRHDDDGEDAQPVLVDVRLLLPGGVVARVVRVREEALGRREADEVEEDEAPQPGEELEEECRPLEVEVDDNRDDLQ
jgi:hypothetical protein